ncbi:MAG: phosphodiester glycosidase family protein, partial [Acidimicrobiia bacterium]
MRRLGVLLVVLFLAVPALAVLAAPGTPPGFTLETQRPLHAGVEYLTYARGGDSPALAHVAHLAPDALVELRAVNARDRITHRLEDRELPSAMCARVNCMVALNGDFWDYQGTRQPLGGVVSGRRMVRSPQGGHPQVTLTGAGRLTAGEMPWSGRVGAADGTMVTLTGVNRSATADALDDDQLVLFTSDWGATAPASNGVELVLDSTERLGSLGRTVTVEAAAGGLRSPGGPIPATGGVLRASGTGEEALRRLWAKVAAADSENRRPLTVSVTSPVDAVESLGTHPVILRDGQQVFDPASDSFTAGRHPRTLLGWNGAGDIFMVTVDDGISESQGMTLADAAALLLGLGATDAVNFDGGGGTTFVVDGEVMNQPEEGEERESVSTLVALRGTASGEQPPTPPPTAPGGGSPGPAPSPPVVVTRSGYWMVGSDGAVYGFGDAAHLGNAPLSGRAQAVDLEPTPTSNGYWIVDDAGHVFTFGDARWLGNADAARLVPGEKVTSLSATPSGNGYWIFTSRGRVLPVGDAAHLGDVSSVTLNGPVLDSIPTPSGRGYY